MMLPKFEDAVKLSTYHNVFTNQVEYKLAYNAYCMRAADLSLVDEDAAFADWLVADMENELRGAIDESVAKECHDTGNKWCFQCSECLSVWPVNGGISLRYCPSCGARVVSE